MGYHEAFEQVWVINLKRRPERLERFFSDLRKAGWPFKDPMVFSAIDGDKVGTPKYWQTGGGSYGCLRSHLTILERAIQDDVCSLLVLEDDATFMPDFGEQVERFLKSVPADWDCLMLGGQHVNSTPTPIAPGIVRAGHGGGIQRTHCYAIRGTAPMFELYRTWANAAVHCDWVMGPCMSKFNTYAPEPFLVGQAHGWSDISGQQNPAKFWRPPTGKEPVVLLKAERRVMEGLQRVGWHGGYDRDPETGIDVGLLAIFSNKLRESEKLERLRQWIEMIQWEVASMADPAICTVWYPDVEIEMLREATTGAVIEITAGSISEALSKLPEDIKMPNYRRIPLVILRSSRQVMEDLRLEGFHTGFSRDPITGEDCGIQEAFTAAVTKEELRARLHRVVRVLDAEVWRTANGVATVWHPHVEPDLFDSEEFEVLEIQAATAADAVKLRDMRLARPACNL